ncbi:senecionine N-oxygenase [Drosophila subpulchrella]|uniref:senecionine N-oxygenase n=1 Tax=Drosophila subpulchrella TaxID=1486046 RepID=UPI0018A1A3AC|nr:senecionine N-oxygenase [Drosophila subpulchrella]
MSVCIIGAGTAGLCCARHSIENGFQTTVFELSDRIGGTWVYNEATGVVNGIDVHSSMYKNLRTNLPKEVMGFPDFEIGKNEVSYVRSDEICDFLNQYADHFQLKKHIKFNTYVIRVVQRNSKWQVLCKDVVTNKIEFHYFDKVMVANGHYHTPNYSKVPNMNRFKGEYLHSHDFRTREVFEGKSVLVIGAGPSGMDLSNIISRSAERVTISHHLTDIGENIFFENVQQKPDVRELDENGAFFVDGTYEEFDTIFFCTGYKYAFPFLTVNSGIYVEDNYVQELYKQCINIRNPSMSLIGLPFYVCAAQMMDIQARFIMSYYNGSNELPSTEEMLKDTYDRMTKIWHDGYRKRHAHMLGPRQIDYFTDLSKTAGVKNIKPVMTKLHNESSKCFNENLRHFREDNFAIVDDETFVKLN